MCNFFCTNTLCAAFPKLQFGFIIFCQEKIGSKAARKMLMKLTGRECGQNSEFYVTSFIGDPLFPVNEFPHLSRKRE